ncbi:MAG TPA: hypothetical protein PKC18_02220 [Lacipirellulaceae bacterium]|nr:hypothetical protein [Lacipirellulaceae bacterium]
MSVVEAPATRSIYVKHILQRLRTGSEPVKFLVFADRQPALLSRVSAALNTSQSLIVPAAQPQWLLPDRSIADAAKWAVAEAGVDRLMIVGSSANRSPDDEFAEDIPFNLTAKRDIAELMRAANAATRRAEQFYAQQIRTILSTPGSSDGLAQGTLRFHGMFYRVESGVFAAYSPIDGPFRALVA